MSPILIILIVVIALIAFLFLIRSRKKGPIQTINETVDLKTIKIGNQVWLAQNLNVSTYRNGDLIPQVKDDKAWSTLTTGAWCYYLNKASNGDKFGKLYNWYAANDPRGLAPNGFHIPTDEEWVQLYTTLGGEYASAAKLKSTTGWAHNGNGNNDSNFSGLPAGLRNKDGGGFNLDIGANSGWWGTKERNNIAWGYFLSCALGQFVRDHEPKQSGLSIRCIKD